MEAPRAKLKVWRPRRARAVLLATALSTTQTRSSLKARWADLRCEHPTEYLTALQVWHKQCFKCSRCSRFLDSRTACDGPDKKVKWTAQ